MQTKSLQKTAFLAILMCLILLAVLGTATYAWFTYNSNVSTDRITAKASDAQVSLLLSETENPFDGSDECDIIQINTFDREKLLPVSTSDLETFVYNNGTKVSNEESYFHGRIYVKATGDGLVQSKMGIYLDNSTDLFINDENSALLNAARLGLAFEGKEPVIIALSDEHNPAGQQIDNTVLGGSRIQSGKPLHMSSNGSVTAVDDPAVSVSEIGIQDNPSAKPIAVIDLNEVYQLDIYFYLEGTDPDCSNYLNLKGSTIQLAFYGAMTEE